MFLLGRDNTRVDLGLRTGQYTRGIAPRGRRVGYTHSGGWGTRKKDIHPRMARGKGAPRGRRVDSCPE